APGGDDLRRPDRRAPPRARGRRRARQGAAAAVAALRARVLTQLAQRGGEGGAQPAGGVGREVGDEAVTGTTLLLDGQHDGKVAVAAAPTNRVSAISASDAMNSTAPAAASTLPEAIAHVTIAAITAM